MIQFKELFFDDKGQLKYAIYGGKTILRDSPLWRVECKDKTYSINDMQKFSYKKEENFIELCWLSDALEVYVTVSYSNKYNFNISLKMKENAINIVHFPVFNDLNSVCDEEGEDYLLMPYQNGWLIKNPIKNILNYTGKTPFWLGRGPQYYENEYPAGYSFQFFSYYCKNTFGYYLATEDSEAYIKTFGIYNDGNNGLCFAVKNYPENMGKTKEYFMPYSFVMSFFQGDWQDAANIYREWAISQKWNKGKLSSIKPNDKVLNIDLWRINHTNYALGTRTQEYVDTSVAISQRLNCNMGLHWYGWNMGEHDVNYPEYISREKLQEGWGEELTAWVDSMRERNFVVLPYVNGRLWDCTKVAWKEEQAEYAALKTSDGKLYDEPWKEDTLKPICPSTSLWMNTVSGFSKYVNNHHLDGLYVDQIGSFNAALCFDENHAHPYGGGTWWKNSYSHMMRMLRNKSGENKIFTTESCCEAYLDVFDLFLVLDTTIALDFAFKSMSNSDCEPIPLFSMLYGDCALLYGSVARFSDNVSVFEYNFIRNIIWGLMPTIEGGTLAEINDKNAETYFEIMHRGVDVYKENKELFVYGRLSRLNEPKCKFIELTFGNETLVYPSLISAVWEDQHGDKFLVSYNMCDESQLIDDGVVINGHTFMIYKI